MFLSTLIDNNVLLSYNRTFSINKCNYISSLCIKSLARARARVSGTQLLEVVILLSQGKQGCSYVTFFLQVNVSALFYENTLS